MRLALLLLVALSGCGKPTANPFQASRDTVHQLADLEGKRGQRVTLTGTLVNADRQVRGNLVVTLRWSGRTTVTCEFQYPPNRPAPDWFLTLETGRTLTVTGTVQEFAPDALTLVSCELLR